MFWFGSLNIWNRKFLKNTLQLLPHTVLPIGAAAAESSFTEMAFPSGTQLEPKLTDPGLEGVLKHPWPGKIDSFGTWGKSLGNFEVGMSPIPGVAAQIHNSMMFAFPTNVYFCTVAFTLKEALLSYYDASSNERPCLFICCWLVYVPFQCCHRLAEPLKFTSVGWLVRASPFQSFQPRQIWTGPGSRE